MATDRTPFTGWSTEVELTVLVRVEVEPDDDYFEGLMGREAWMLAAAAVRCRTDPSSLDGFADLRGEVEIIDVYRGS